MHHFIDFYADIYSKLMMYYSLLALKIFSTTLRLRLPTDDE